MNELVIVVMKKIILVLVLMWAVPSFAGYQEGRVAFKRGDYANALKEFRALAESKDARGQYGLGIMHDVGEGVPQSSEEAAKWYRLAAEQGHADAQNNLGVMYEEGEGVTQNYEEAMKWYRKAAESGNKDAPNNIGVMYMTGVGVRRDFVKADMWFNIAGKSDPSAASNRDFLKKRMTPEEITQAENLAKEWAKIRSQDEADERLARDQKLAVEESKKYEGQENSNEADRLARQRKLLEEERKKLVAQRNSNEADRLVRERRLFEEERKKIEALRLAEENRKQQGQSSGEQLPPSGTGSGFFVSKLGHVITNAHVVKGCNRVTVGDNANKQVPAEIINTDRSNDLALLKLSTLEMASAESKSLIQKLSIVVVPLASKGLLRSDDVRLGEKVLVAGYPFGDFFSNSIKVTTGVVSSTRGAGDDSGQFQLDAAVQPGNSGGPIYDSGGNIVGVVISQLDKLKVAKAIGSLPENVNFGIKASTVRQFLISSGLPSKKSEQTDEKSTEQLAEIAKNQALMVMCLQ
jgi:S1-C subfamily serine protease